MTDATAPRSLNCPNCGAPLDFPPGQASIRCRFCDSTIERSIADLTDDDDAHIIHVDYSGLASPAGPARRFVLKMRNGEPVVIEVGQAAPPPRAGTPPNLDRARRSAAAAVADRRRAASRAAADRQPAAQRASPGCVLSAVAVVAVAVIVAALLFANSPRGGLLTRQLLAGNVQQALATSRTLGATLVLLDSGVLVPDPAGGPDQALLLSVHYAGSDRVSEYRLIAVDTGERRLLWQSEPLGPDLYSTPILADADRVYLVSGATLLALHRADGTQAWSAPLADALSLNICAGCLQLTGGRLAALSADGTLAVYDAATGEQQWTATSIQASPRGLVVLGQRLAFMDRNEEVQGVLRTFDLATGREQSVVPECQPAGDDRAEYADWTTALLPSPDGASVYLAFGYLPACLQRWDARSLELAWSALLPEGFVYSLDQGRLVLTADELYLAGGPQLVAVNVADGAVRPLVEAGDNELAIEAVTERDVILRAQRTRGTTRYALWAVDPATGATRWTFDLGDSPPVEPSGIIDEDTPEWQVQPSAEGLRLLRFRAAADDRSHALLTETLDWQTGQSAGQTVTVLNVPTIIFSGPAWTLWKADTLWMVIENQLVAFDAVANRVTTRWP